MKEGDYPCKVKMQSYEVIGNNLSKTMHICWIETAKLSIVLIRLLIDFGHPRLPDSGQSFFRLTLIIPREFSKHGKRKCHS